MGRTHWQIGSFNREKGMFTAGQGKASAGSEEGIGSCGQSLTDAKGRRVQFGWQHINLGVTEGAQSLPRVITAAPEATGGGLLLSPLPELATLHNASTHQAKKFTIAGGQSLRQAGIDPETGLHHHMKLNVTLSATVKSEFDMCVQCDGGHPGVVVSFATDGSSAVTVGVGGTSQTLTLPTGSDAAVVEAELFTDGLITELFAGQGEVALSHVAQDVHASGIGYKASGAAVVAVELELWHMVTSVF